MISFRTTSISLLNTRKTCAHGLNRKVIFRFGSKPKLWTGVLTAFVSLCTVNEFILPCSVICKYSGTNESYLIRKAGNIQYSSITGISQNMDKELIAQMKVVVCNPSTSRQCRSMVIGKRVKGVIALFLSQQLCNLISIKLRHVHLQ